MTDDEMRIAIAEARGAKWVHGTFCGEPKVALTFKAWLELGLRRWDTKDGRTLADDIPDYLNDLNAMHEAEALLAPEQTAEFMRHLWDLVKDTCPNYIKYAAFAMAHATARQRAEAFLRVTRPEKFQ